MWTAAFWPTSASSPERPAGDAGRNRNGRIAKRETGFPPKRGGPSLFPRKAAPHGRFGSPGVQDKSSPFVAMTLHRSKMALQYQVKLNQFPPGHSISPPAASAGCCIRQTERLPPLHRLRVVEDRRQHVFPCPEPGGTGRSHRKTRPVRPPSEDRGRPQNRSHRGYSGSLP